MFPEAWVAFAHFIVQNDPSDVGLRRAIGALYYAMLHIVAKDAADLFIGEVQSFFGEQARMQVYRSLDHRRTRLICGNNTTMQQFSPQIRNFAEIFVAMQRKRHAADYDPSAHFKISDVISDIIRVGKAIRALNTADPEERKAFIALILFKTRTP